jgi:dihydroorotate dehydrogenase electron transfer subunit
VKRTLDRARVLHNQHVARDTFVLTLSARFEAPPHPGQFVMVHPLREGCLLGRPFSILDYRDGELDLLVKVVGRGSRALAGLQEEDTVRLFGPLGHGFDAPELLDRPAIFVAGGVGIVPLHWLARRLAPSTRPCCIFGARTPADLPRAVLRQYEPGWELWVERQPEADCHQGLVTEGLARALDCHPAAAVAACGPTPMLQATARLCREQGRRLWVCLEEQMGCGAGVCRACVVPAADGARMRTVCTEGPVFAIDEIRYARESGG